MKTKMSVSRCCCCSSDTCWYDNFSTWTVGDDLIQTPYKIPADPATPYNGFYGNETAIVQSGNLLRLSGPNSSGQAQFNRTWGLSNPDSLIGSTYANKTEFNYGINDWVSNSIIGTSGFYLGFIGRNSEFRILIADNNSSAYSPYLNYTAVGVGFRQVSLPAITPYPSAIAKRYSFQMYDFAFIGTVFGARRYSFEFKVLYDSTVVLESLTGTTRNEIKGYIDFIDWCLDPYSAVDAIVNPSPPGYIELDEFSFYINGNNSCTPTPPPAPGP